MSVADIAQSDIISIFHISVHDDFERFPGAVAALFNGSQFSCTGAVHLCDSRSAGSGFIVLIWLRYHIHRRRGRGNYSTKTCPFGFYCRQCWPEYKKYLFPSISVLKTRNLLILEISVNKCLAVGNCVLRKLATVIIFLLEDILRNVL